MVPCKTDVVISWKAPLNVTFIGLCGHRIVVFPDSVKGRDKGLRVGHLGANSGITASQ